MAPLGLSLAAFRPRASSALTAARPPRPEGRLVWLHVSGSDPAPAAEELMRRLAEREGVSVLLTGPASGDLSEAMHQDPPEDGAAEVRAFLEHWRPEALVLSDGGLRPALIAAARARGLPVLLTDARAPRLIPGSAGWFSGTLRKCLAALSYIAAVDDAAAAAFRKAGAPPQVLAITGRMEERCAVLPCLEAERAALAKLFASRPVWFAASLPDAEEAAVLSAHRRVLGQSHRLLLILLPADPARAQPLAEKLEEEGWIVALRSAEEDPEPETEVFVVDSPAELGLWYRLAPITFLGNSLSGNGAARSPMEPAALGSAILHGPRAGVYGALLGRLGAARAARAVAAAPDLAEALGDLLAPDRAARLAQAAWIVASDGAEATEAVLDRLRALSGAK
ncbi:3-deoxy-D-manno-octulosonic acid transferase [Neotabrizicola sp. sgz301269]|uniref:3-deoxy-D-manno-octulosonic acid transferase n=1 Tax=Neotabrizicola sp. sgz301269 TaxID=3276282 RepID=UPI0037700DA2